MANSANTKINVEEWKKSVIELTSKIHSISKEYNTALNEWADARDEAGDAGKSEVDDCIRELTDARSSLCSLRGGRSQRKQRRSRRNRW